QGLIQRLGKGLYYRPRTTVFGPSRPNPASIRNLPIPRKATFPAGLAAAHLLGFTTQNPARLEGATNATSLPRPNIGPDGTVHTRRPEAWQQLSEVDAALLDFLRQRASTSELSPEETVRKLLDYFRESERFERVAAVAPSEPPRVRAMLGAIGQELGKAEAFLASLRHSLNPLSRFDFGILLALRHARAWQAKEQPRHETL